MNTQQIVSNLVAQDVPVEKAEAKSRSVTVGVIGMILGFILAVGGAALPTLAYFHLKQPPTLYTLLFGGGVFLCGLWLLANGAHGASGEAMDSADGLLGALGKLIGALRSKV